MSICLIVYAMKPLCSYGFKPIYHSKSSLRALFYKTATTKYLQYLSDRIYNAYKIDSRP